MDAGFAYNLHEPFDAEAANRVVHLFPKPLRGRTLTGSSPDLQILRQSSSVVLRHILAEPAGELAEVLAEALTNPKLAEAMKRFDGAFGKVVAAKPSPMDPGASLRIRRVVGEDVATEIAAADRLTQAVAAATAQLNADALLGGHKMELLQTSTPTAERMATGTLPGVALLHHVRLHCGQMAGVALVGAFVKDEPLPHEHARALWGAVLEGKRSYLALLASVGVPIPEDILPLGDRFDLKRETERAQRAIDAIDAMPIVGAE